MLTEHTINQKYADYVQPLNQDFFGIINERAIQLDANWASKKILDFGCNVANLLLTSKGAISEENYTGVDVQRKALAIASSKFPKARFIHYDGYHVAFNPSGVRGEFPNIESKQDVIIAHGVFTHCDVPTILEQMSFFKSILEPNGMIVFSIWEQEHLSRYVDIFLKEILGVQVPNVIVPFERTFFLIDRKYSIVDQDSFNEDQCTWIETFYTRQYVQQLIPGAVALPGRKTKHTIFILKP